MFQQEIEIHVALDFDRKKSNTDQKNLLFRHHFSAAKLALKLDHLMQLFLLSANNSLHTFFPAFLSLILKT